MIAAGRGVGSLLAHRLASLPRPRPRYRTWCSAALDIDSAVPRPRKGDVLELSCTDLAFGGDVSDSGTSLSLRIQCLTLHMHLHCRGCAN